MIYLLNADRGAVDSVAHLVRAGKVTHLNCGSYPEFEKHVDYLMGLTPTDEDVVVVDTLTRLADSARGDMKLGLEGSLWEKKNIFFADKNYLTVYEAASQLIMRRLRNLNNRGWRIITIAHEDEQMDPVAMLKKRGPALNPALYNSLVGSCTDMFRLTVLREDEEKFPAGTRMLQTTMSDDALAKYQVEPSDEGVYPSIPKFIPQPTMRRIFTVLKKKPSWLTIYGEPGAGKTSLACSEVYPAKKKDQSAS